MGLGVTSQEMGRALAEKCSLKNFSCLRFSGKLILYVHLYIFCKMEVFPSLEIPLTCNNGEGALL